MEYLWIIVGVILALVGVLGSILPVLPGPPIAYVGLLLQQLRDDPPYSTKFLLIWAGVVLVTLVLDFLVPIWFTRRFGGSKYGVWGCTIGFIAGFWLGPMGMIIGPFLGAFVGEMIAGKDSNQSFRAALGSFAGFLIGTFFKIVACLMMMYYILASI